MYSACCIIVSPRSVRQIKGLDAERQRDILVRRGDGTASIARARETLGYAPRYSALDALHEALTWLVTHGQVDVGGQPF